MKKYLACLLLGLCVHVANAKLLPNDICLKTKNANHSPNVFLLHNISAKTFMVDRAFPNKRPPLSAGWISSIAPKHWSVIVVNQPTVCFRCLSWNPSNITPLPCKKMLQVYEAPAFLSHRMHRGGYWFIENQTLWKSLLKILSVFPEKMERYLPKLH